MTVYNSARWEEVHILIRYLATGQQVGRILDSRLFGFSKHDVIIGSLDHTSYSEGSSKKGGLVWLEALCSFLFSCLA